LVYNGKDFIADSIESVLVQTYSHVECIVVDDGSIGRLKAKEEFLKACPEA
jgi:glycosyltransferase involved in cell wall biosynthesis